MESRLSFKEALYKFLPLAIRLRQNVVAVLSREIHFHIKKQFSFFHSYNPSEYSGLSGKGFFGMANNFYQTAKVNRNIEWHPVLYFILPVQHKHSPYFTVVNIFTIPHVKISALTW